MPAQSAAQLVIEAARATGRKITCAESCTGGMVAAALTDVPGASDVFECGFVTYSNVAKTNLIGVPADRLEKFGAVSTEVAAAMAEGACMRGLATLAVSITGIAGPGGGTLEKPVGTVCFGLAQPDHPTFTEKLQFSGSRAHVRAQATAHALALLLGALQ